MIGLDTETFELRVIAGKEPAIVCFLADWCGPCRLQRKILETLRENSPSGSGVLIAGVDVDACEALAQRYGVKTLPSVLIFADGEVLEALVGFQSEEYLKSYVEYLTREKPSPAPVNHS